jgi:glutathione S-transferase
MHTRYGYTGSGSAAIEAALVLAGLPHRSVHAASWDEHSALAELKRLNPLGQIPTLVTPEGAALTQSTAGARVAAASGAGERAPARRGARTVPAARRTGAPATMPR